MQATGPDATPWRIAIESTGEIFPATGSETVLAAAARAGVELLSACRNGTCRACLRPLRQGRVDYTIAWPGLLPEERDGRWLLPCVAQARSDLVLG